VDGASLFVVLKRAEDIAENVEIFKKRYGAKEIQKK
jgi:hypothetical protein